MKTFSKQLFFVSIIIVSLFGSITPTQVFAQDEQPIVTESVAVETTTEELVSTEEVTAETETEELVATETLAAEQLPTEGENVITVEATQAPESETTLQSEKISEIVELMADEGMTLVDESGSALPMASIETNQILENSDPFFWDGTKWVGYTVSGIGCPTNVTCIASATPFQAAVTAASALTVETTIYVATGTYNEDVVINSTKLLSFAAFNSVTVDGINVSITNPGFAKVNKITLNSNFGSTNGVYADSVIVGTNGEVSDALNLVNPINVEATITAQMKLVSANGYYNIQDSNTPADSYEWECAEPDVTIGTNVYTMVLKNPKSEDVLNYFTVNSDERPDFSAMDASIYLSKNYVAANANLQLSAKQRMDDVISAASASEAGVAWSNMDEQRVIWNLLGHMSGKVNNNNYTGAYDGNLIQTENQFNLAKQFTFTDNLLLPAITQKIWFLWPSGTANTSNTQLTFMKLAIPNTGCTDPTKCTSCPFGQELIANVGCQPIICTFGNQLNAAGTGCEPIVCTFGNQLNAAGNACEPIVCSVGSTLNSAGNACVPIVCGADETLVGNDCIANPPSSSTPQVQAAVNLAIPVTGGLQIPVTGTRIIVAGLGHTCMTAGNGEVLCWGLNASGQVGDGTNDNRLKPVLVEDLDEVVDLTAGSLHTCALKSNGEVWCWGENESGQIGNGTTTDTNLPVFVDGLPDKAIDITGGEEFTCALLKNMDVWCWGENGLGQLNDGSTINRAKPVKSLLNKLQNAIAAGQEALLSDAAGSVDAWSAEQATLVQEMGNSLFLFGDRWNMGGCAINFNGQVKCWNDDPISKFVEGSKPAYMVETGIAHGCSLNADGTISCWGNNQYGQLGNGTNQESASAVLATGISEAKEIGIGRNHSCVLVGEGNTAMCWGENTYGQLGNDSTIDSNLPVYVIEP